MSVLATQRSEAGTSSALPQRVMSARRRIGVQVVTRNEYWIEAFIGLEIVGQLALALVQLGPYRALVRCVAYASSLGLLAFLPRSGRLHPAARAACIVIIILAVSMFHPTTNSMVSGAAQVAMYVAILAPLFWVTGLPVDTLRLRRVLVILWAFHSASSTVAIIQVSHPTLLPQTLSSVTEAQGKDYVDSLRFKTPDGARVFRPMGLGDLPGAASVSGFYAVLFGLGFLLCERSPLLRAAAFASIAAGLTALYLSQVRAMLVMLVVCIVAVYVPLLWAGERTKVFTMSVALIVLAATAYVGAAAIGGEAITRRLETLTDSAPQDTYDKNRGHFLTDTVTQLLPEYPLGAGLGRWGMMNQYFGDSSDVTRGRIWVEIQWTGWLLDGGVPLVIAYSACLFFAIWTAWQIAVTPIDGTLRIWAAIVLAYNIGALAITFNYPFFVSQGAMELWLLNAALLSSRDHIRVLVCPAPNGSSGLPVPI